MSDTKHVHTLHSVLFLFALMTTIGTFYFSVTHTDLSESLWIIISALVSFVLCCLALIYSHKILMNNYNMLKSMQMYAGKLKESQDELQHVLNCLDPGVVKIIFDNKLHRTVAWANNGFFELSGHGREGYAAAMGEARNIVHPDDIEWVFKAFEDHAQKRGKMSIEYRIVHKNGSIVWLHVTSSYVGEENGNPVFINIMMNITAQKDMRDKLLMERQRYELVNSLSNEILFEYDAGSDTLTTYGNSSRLLGEEPVIPRFSARLKKLRCIHPDDVHVLGDMLHNIECETPLSSPKFRLLLGAEDYQWHYACYSILHHGGDNTTLAVGKLVNIHESAVLIEKLQLQSALDGMTGLHNKTSFAKHVDLDLKTMPLSGYAFLIVDVDNFKSINDTYGHPYGDDILKAVAHTLKSSFRSTDCIGRAGGDEFVILMRDVRERQIVEERIEVFYTELHKLRIAPHSTVTISASIGCAMYPQCDKKYEELFAQADQALYMVKRNGKGHFAFC